MKEYHYQVSDRITLAFTGLPGEPADVWVIEAPGPDGSGGQVRLNADEFEHLIARGRYMRASARPVTGSEAIFR